jgi:hypothetical protein
MKYLLTLYAEEGGWEDASPQDAKAMMDRWSALGKEMVDAGAHLAGEGLQESHTATTVRLRADDAPIVTDGPFAETKEQLGGFYLLECADLDEALEWARKIPMRGAVEVRPVMDYTQFGYEDPAAAKEIAS